MIAALVLALLLAQSPEKHRGGAPAQDISITLPKTPETLVVPGETVWKMFAGLLAAVGGPLFGIGKWFVNKHNAEIDALKLAVAAAGSVSSNAVQRDEYEQHKLAEGAANAAAMADSVKHSEYEQNRQEMRTGIIELHKKIEGVSLELNSKIDGVNEAAQLRHNEVMSILVKMR